MVTVEFLTEMLPAEGFICIAHPPLKAPPGEAPRGMSNVPYLDRKQAASYAVRRGETVDVYVALFTFRDTVENIGASGNSYQRIRRTQENAWLTRLAWSDLDVGESTAADKKYATVREAVVAIMAFCDDIGLPRPMLVNSGYGVHCYWRFDRDVTREEWQPMSSLLKRVFAFKGVLTDTKVTADAARVLRVPGTWNHKFGAQKRVRFVGDLSKPVPFAVFLAILQKVEAEMPEPEVQEVTTWTEQERPKVKTLRDVCPTFTRMAAEAPSASEGVWWATLQLCRHTTGGEKLGHALAALHPDYQREETQGKLDRMTALNLGPPTCGTLQKLYGDESPCPGCPNFGLFASSPIVFARRKPETELPAEIPPPERPYLRTKRGIEFQPLPNPDMPKPPNPVVIYPYDFYPTRIVDDAIRRTKAVEWIADVPIKGKITVVMQIDAYAQEDKMISTLAHQGVTIDKRHAKNMGGYVSHYIKTLQAHAAEQQQLTTMGWITGSNYTRFLWGTQVITVDGFELASIAPSAINAAHSMTRAGTLEKQIEAQNFYDHDDYLPQQFYAMCALGAPLMHMTRHHGVIVNLTGPTGASKSSCAMQSGGYYGDPRKFVQNGTTGGFTVKARAARIETLASMPLILDETTNMPPEAIKDAALAISQGGHPVRLDSQGREIPIPDSLKSTFMLSTSNNSMHAVLAFQNVAGTAGSMRVNEASVGYTKVHTKTQADAFLQTIQENYGWIGPEFIRHVIRDRANVERRMAALMVEIDKRGHIQPGERFWAASFAVAVMACAIASAKGWVPYDADKLLDWCLEVQLPRLRAVVSDAYMTPVGVLQAFLMEAANNILVVRAQPHGVREMDVLNKPHGELMGRYEPDADTGWVAVYAFRRFCERHKLSYDGTVRYLRDQGILKTERVNLARNVSSVPGVVTRVLEIDMAHTELTGLPPVETKDGAQIIQFRAAPLTARRS